MANSGSDYVKFSMFSAFLIGVLPMIFRVYKTQSTSYIGNGTITFNVAFSNVSFFIFTKLKEKDDIHIQVLFYLQWCYICDNEDLLNSVLLIEKEATEAMVKLTCTRSTSRGVLALAGN